MRISILIIWAFVVTTAKAQTSLPGPDSLFASIDTFYNQKLASEIAAFEASPKDYWMNFVPSVGVAYTPSGAPRPAVSFSLNSLLQTRKQKQQIKAMRESIVLKNQIERQENKIQVSKILKQIEILNSDLKFSLQVFEIENQLFEFYEKQNQNNDIRPSEFLIKKIAHLKKEESIRIQQREIGIIILDLYETSHLKF